jgi:propanol-preferring alcohol dehydrogenase
VKAILLPGDGTAVVTNLPDPRPGADEVVVRQRASAICRTDMVLYHGTLPGWTGTVVPGHESAGEVVAVGEAVRSVQVGDRIAIHLAYGCGHCEYCRAGMPNLCRKWRCQGFDTNGGDAEYAVVPERNCLPMPEGMSFPAAAVSTDMIGTQYSTQNRLGVSGAGWLAVFGIGPMGAASVMVGHARGARVIAVDPIEPRLGLAKELGADVALKPGDAVVEAIMDHTCGGASWAIDCSGNPQAQLQALDCVARQGTVAFVGESNELTIHPADQIIRKHVTLTWGWYFPTWQYPAIAAFIMEQHLPAEKMISHRFGLDGAPEAFRLFDERKTAGKVIFEM